MRVSGTIKKSEAEAIRRARLHIRRAQRASGRGKLGAVRVDTINAVDDEDDDDDVEMFNGIEDREEVGGADEDDEE